MDYELLISQIAMNNMDALEALYQDMYADVFALALSMVRNQATAADLAQDTFLQVCRGAPGYKPRGTPKAWILKITKNLARNHIRAQKRLHGAADDFLVQLPAENPYAAPELQEALACVFRSCSLRQRTVFGLRAQGYVHREIAAIMGLPEGTVRWLYAGVLKQCRGILSGL